MSSMLTFVCRLDSRSRKKQYTKDLESDKKFYLEEINNHKDAIEKLTLQLNELKMEREREYLHSQEVLRNLQYEREEIVARHTLETGDLRKRVSILSDQLKNNTMPMSAAPSSAGFNDLGLGMESLNMCQDWDWMVDPNSMEESTANVNSNGMPDIQPNADMHQHPQDTALVPSRKADADKAVPTGLLLMLLLCGAFVASKPSGHNAPPIRMPEDVRQASAHVLDNIFKDAGVSPASTSSSNLHVHHMSNFEPQASAGVSNPNWHPKSHTITGAEFARLTGPSSSSLDSLHHDLTAPTKEQEAEQVFGMTPALYNSLTAPHHHQHHDHHHHLSSNSLHSPPLTNEDPTTSPSPPFGGSSRRKLLAETLASMRESSRENAAQVYTRSLLWNEVPENVVQEFKRIVEQSGSANEMGKDDGGGGGGGGGGLRQMET